MECVWELEADCGFHDERMPAARGPLLHTVAFRDSVYSQIGTDSRGPPVIVVARENNVLRLNRVRHRLG